MLVACLAVEVPAFSQDPSLAELLAKHIAAKGGAEALANLEGLHLEGNYTAFSVPAPFTLLRWRGDDRSAVRFEYSMLEKPVVEVFDGSEGWAFNELSGVEWPAPMLPPERASLRAFSDLTTPLVGHADQGYELELAGREDFDGVDSWRIDLRRDGDGEGDERAESWFLDATSFLEAGAVVPRVDFGSGHQGRLYFSDFRPVGGVMIPHRVEEEFFMRHRVMEVAKAVANPSIDPAVFDLPLLAPMEDLASLAGDWQVKVETRPYPGAAWAEAETTSTITSSFGGSRLEERIVLQLGGRAIDHLNTLTWDRFRETYQWTRFDNFSSLLDILRGTRGEDQRIVTDNLETGTALGKGSPIYQRASLYEVTDDGFQVDLSVSTDGGENWFHNVRLTYSRE
ncbi:MAG: DUF1579 family protein [Acidobacteriota bacterium]